MLKNRQTALYSQMGREYNRPDERKWFICGAGYLDITPKWGDIQTCLIT
jgi:hypothetical protein